MAITTTLTALNTTTATKIFQPVTGSLQDPTPIFVQNQDAAITIYIGGPSVTKTGADTGIELLAGQMVPMSMVTGDILYAISASGTPNVCVMAGRQ